MTADEVRKAIAAEAKASGVPPIEIAIALVVLVVGKLSRPGKQTYPGAFR